MLLMATSTLPIHPCPFEPEQRDCHRHLRRRYSLADRFRLPLGSGDDSFGVCERDLLCAAGILRDAAARSLARPGAQIDQEVRRERTWTRSGCITRLKNRSSGLAAIPHQGHVPGDAAYVAPANSSNAREPYDNEVVKGWWA
jgi:hypothetical protein